MSIQSRKRRAQLLTGAGTALIAAMTATSALADPTPSTATQTSSNSITVQQQSNGYLASSETTGANNVTVNNNDAAAFALQNSTVSVGNASGTGNSSSATGYANTASLTVNGDLNNVTGSGTSSVSGFSSSDIQGPLVGSSTDIGIALSQQSSSVNAGVVSDTDFEIDLDHGASASTAKIAGNSSTATGVLNSGVNTIAATANNSSGSSAIGSSQQSLESTLASVASSQLHFDTGQVTSGEDAGIALSDSTVGITGNTLSATGVANSVANTQSITGNTLTLAADNGGALTGVGSQADAGYAIASNQELAGTDDNAASVSATVRDNPGNSGSQALIDGAMSGSVLHNDSNTFKALARGNEGVNATTITANSVSTGDAATPVDGNVAAVSSMQKLTGDVTVTAAITDGAGVGPIVSNVITGDVKASSAVTASGNAALADAVGNRAGNSIAVNATTISTATDGAATPTNVNLVNGVASSSSAFAVGNAQTVGADSKIVAHLVDSVDETTPATYRQAGTSILTSIGGNVLDSSVTSSNNALEARAVGNETLSGGNAITLTGTNVSTTAGIANSQSMLGDATLVIGSGGTAATAATPGTDHSFTFTGTSTGDPGNYNFHGTATGTQADRDALQAAYPSLAFSYASGVITLDAGEQLAQISSFSASYTSGATAATAGTPGTGGVIVTVGHDITNSSVTVADNLTSGVIKGNSASNALTVSATNLNRGTDTDATTAVVGSGAVATADQALVNAQTVGSDSALSSKVGAVFTVTASSLDDQTLGNVTNSTVSVSDNAASTAVTGNTASNAVALSATNLATTSALVNAQTSRGGITSEISSFTDNDNATYSGAVVQVARDIADSSILVDGNAFTGSATGNAATNSLSVTGASSLTAADEVNGATADPYNGVNHSLSATADHALTNAQSLATGDLSTSVTASYGIQTLGVGAPGNTNDTSDVTGSTLSVSDNVQSATTTGNTATNSVALAGGSISASSALLSSQSADYEVNVNAVSDMMVSAPAANTDSSLTMSGNSNTATATVNTATNKVTLAADTGLASTVTGGAADTNPAGNGLFAVQADHVVNNVQAVASGAGVSATAVTLTQNSDGNSAFMEDNDTPSDGILRSTVTVSGNSTAATALSNRSVNSLALSAVSDTASAAVLNQQASGAEVTAQAATFTNVSVAGYNAGSTDPSPIDTSAVSITGNSVTARAGGNNATNSLTATATNLANANTGGTATVSGTGPGNSTDHVSASFAVLNEQTNTGSVSATAGFAFPNFNIGNASSQGTAPSIINASLTISGNSAVAVGYGNAATNSMSVSALNSGATPTTSAIASNQYNSGDVSAYAYTVNYAAGSTSGSGNTGPVSASSLSVNGNAIGAAAYGNSATSTLTVGGNNVNVSYVQP